MIPIFLIGENWVAVLVVVAVLLVLLAILWSLDYIGKRKADKEN